VETSLASHFFEYLNLEKKKIKKKKEKRKKNML